MEYEVKAKAHQKLFGDKNLVVNVTVKDYPIKGLDYEIKLKFEKDKRLSKAERDEYCEKAINYVLDMLNSKENAEDEE